MFGWTAESAGPEYGGYINFSKDGTRVAGCMQKDPATMAGMPDAWAIYLASDDAQATCDAAVAAGGGVMMGPMEIPAIGNMAYVTDPSGAAVGLFQTTGETSFGYDGVADGTPAWFELFTKDFAPTIAFYEQVFGWKTSSMGDTDEFRYSTLGDGRRRQGRRDGRRRRSSPRACPPTGRCTSASPTPTPRSRRSPGTAARS